MRKLKYVLPLLFSVGILLAASPFKGNWKMNHAKSNATRGSVPKAEEMTIADEGDHLKVNIVGTNADGTPIAISYTIPVSGGTGQIQEGGSYNGVSARRINDSTRDTSYSKDGQQLDAEHMVVADDGNTMTVTVKGVDSSGKPIEEVLVFEKQ